MIRLTDSSNEAVYLNQDNIESVGVGGGVNTFGVRCAKITHVSGDCSFVMESVGEVVGRIEADACSD